MTDGPVRDPGRPTLQPIRDVASLLPGLGISAFAFVIVIIFAPATVYAGPPYVTDDPEPVEFRHWEFYLATQHFATRTAASGTAPHIE